jgi:energy-coupling factor transporter ATP-binding protein EcfA2
MTESVSLWWVCQGRSYKEELETKQIWAPQRDVQGNPHYYLENVSRVKANDFVINYSQGKIRAISIATAGAYESPPPDYSQGKWTGNGWKVDLSYLELDQPVSLESVTPRILDIEISDRGPFTKQAQVKQGYLFELSKQEADLLVNIIGKGYFAALDEGGSSLAVQPLDINKNIFKSYAKVANKVSEGKLEFRHIKFDHELEAYKQIKDKTKTFLENPTVKNFKDLWNRQQLWSASQKARADFILQKNDPGKIAQAFTEMQNNNHYEDEWEKRLGATNSLREFWARLKDQPLENGCADNALTWLGYVKPRSYSEFVSNFTDLSQKYLNANNGQATKYALIIELDQLFNTVDKLRVSDMADVIDNDLLSLCIEILTLKHQQRLDEQFKKYTGLIRDDKDYFDLKTGETYKFNCVAGFRSKFDLKRKDLNKMLDESLSEARNLIEAGNYYPRRTLVKFFSPNEPARTRKAFESLFSLERIDSIEKVDHFIDSFKDMLKSLHQQKKVEDKRANSFIDYRFVSFILAALYPDKYFYVKYDEYSTLIRDLEPDSRLRDASPGQKFLSFQNVAAFIKSYLRSKKEYPELHSYLTSRSKFKDESISWGTYDFIFACAHWLNDETNSWIFQGNPERFDILDFLEKQEKGSWAANQNKEQLASGDKVYFWKSGVNAGIYGQGSILNSFYERSEDDISRGFGKYAVDVKIDKFLGDNYLSRESFLNNSILQKSKIVRQSQGTNFLLAKEEADEIEKLMNTGVRYWQIAPGEGARFWVDCLEGGFICFGWEEIGDLSHVKTLEQLQNIVYDKYPNYSKRESEISIRFLWNLLMLKNGDIVLANKGRDKILGVGRVLGSYNYDTARQEYKHTTKINWYDTNEYLIPQHLKGKFGKTITSLTADEVQEIIGGAMQSFYKFFENNGFTFSKETLSNYILSLKTKPFVLLTGISGTGKTKIAQLTADFFAPETTYERQEPLPKNEEGSYYYQVKPYFLKYHRLIVSKELASMMDVPSPGESTEIEVIFDNQSQMCSIKYWIQPDKYDYISIGFRGLFNQWASKNLVVGDYIHIEVVQNEDSSQQQIRITKYSPKTIQTKAHSDRCVFVSVRPDWMDCKGLLGFYNLLTEEYQPTEFLKLLIRAAKEIEENPSNPKPYFVILDEMNLAKVEHYFSDFLSCLESRRIDMKNGELKQEPLILHDCARDLTFKDSDGSDYFIAPKLEIPLNVFFTGTVNIDETTYMFSPKVLDRANVIEFNQVNLLDESDGDASFAISEQSIDNTLLTRDLLRTVPGKADFRKLPNEQKQLINSLHKLLKKFNLHFGYRVCNEIACYLNNTEDLIGNNKLDQALDIQILQKVLPKFHGSKQKLQTPLVEIIQFALGDSELQEGNIDSYIKNQDDKWLGILKKAKYPRSAQKLNRMLRTLSDQGFVSFIE